MSTVALFRVTYNGPTDTRGTRLTVRDMMTGTRRVVPFDYSAPNAGRAAVSRVTGIDAARIDYVGEDSRGKYYALPLAAVEDIRNGCKALVSATVGSAS